MKETLTFAEPFKDLKSAKAFMKMNGIKEELKMVILYWEEEIEYDKRKGNR